MPVDRVHAVVDHQFFEPVVRLRLNLKWDVSDRVFDHYTKKIIFFLSFLIDKFSNCVTNFN